MKWQNWLGVVVLAASVTAWLWAGGKPGWVVDTSSLLLAGIANVLIWRSWP